MSGLTPPYVASRLLAVAAVNCADEIERVARYVDHARGDVLFREGQPLEELLFPVLGLISSTVNTREGQTVEVAINGVEGMAGVSRYLGHTNADTNAVMLVTGRVAHVPADDVARWASEVPEFRVALQAFVRSLLVETQQSAVCNQLHSVEQRTSRWLLHASDRAHTADLRLTHEFLSQMLAVRRSSVTNVVGIFTRAGLTTTQRGLISIADRDGLRTFTCECYAIVRAASAD